MSELREAAQAVVDKHNPRTNMSDWWDAIDHLRAALALPETEAEPVAWAVMCDGNAVQTFLTETAANLIAENRREQTRGRGFDWQTTPLYARPLRNEWREAVHDELVTVWALSAENKDDPRKALQDVINWHVRVSLDPAVSLDAQALIERGKAVRSGWRPASEPPDTTRSVLIWLRFGDVETFGKALGGPSGFAFQNGAITHWRDIEPPSTES